MTDKPICSECGKPMARNGQKKNKQMWRCFHCNKFATTSTTSSMTEEKNQIGITESQLRAKHDLRYIFERKCAELKPNVYMTLAEFIQICGIKPGAGYRGIIDHPDYDKFHGKAGGVVYWSHPDSIRKLKDEGILI